MLYWIFICAAIYFCFANSILKRNIEQFTQTAKFAGQAITVLQFTAPEANHFPTAAPQFPVDCAGALNIGQNLFPPIFLPCFGNLSMTRAIMPKAPVNKNSHPFTPENKIWLPKNPRIAAPSRNFLIPQNFRKSYFSFAVSGRTNSRHNIRSFLRCKNICHHYSLLNRRWIFKFGCIFTHLRHFRYILQPLPQK